LVSAGWGGLGGTEVPEEVFILKGDPSSPVDEIKLIGKEIFHMIGFSPMVESQESATTEVSFVSTPSWQGLD